MMNRETGFSSSDTLVVVDRSRRRRWVIAAGLAIVALAVAVALFMRSGAKPADDESQKAGQAPSVSVIVPGQTTVARTITASGELAARRDQPVGVPGEGGQVSRVLVDAGSWVRAGQVLATIDRSVQVQQGAQIQAQIASARAQAALAQSNYERAQSLVARGFVSKADLESKRAARDAALASVRVAQAQLGQNRAQVARLDIRAPSDGLVLERNVEVGQVVGPGAGALFRLARGGEVEMRAQMPQQDLGVVRTGMTASVTPLGSERSFAGRVWQVAPTIDPQTRQGEVRIAIPFDPAIRPGGFGEARILAGETTAPVLPQSAVLSDTRGNFVYVLGAGNKVQRREVKVGSVSEAGVAIAEGLAGTESVVETAGPFLNQGQEVKPRRATRKSVN